VSRSASASIARSFTLSIPQQATAFPGGSLDDRSRQMSGAVFTGLTWDHPRGFKALEAAAEKEPGLIRWSRQPLEGFESHPIRELANDYDLLVVDHPHIGETAADGCLQPLEAYFDAAQIARWGQQSIGAALRSYRWGGKHYALPLDVAMQVTASDSAVLPTPPDSWDEVLSLSQRVPTALSLAGPHALLTFYSICLSLGEEPGSEEFIATPVGTAALEIMQALAKRRPNGSETLNPIALLEAVSRRAGIALVPLVFGYVNYASISHGIVRFSEAPRIGPGGRRGSVIGGTGIAISRRTKPSEALLAHLRWLMSDEAQSRFIPQHEGQPSSRAAWLDPSVNAVSGNFYAATIQTAEEAWVRPRFDGYIDFQTRASAVIRNALSSEETHSATLRRLRDLWHAATKAARDPIQHHTGQAS
jgi:multiple sugar transport system substrate-binding protein